MKVLHIFTSDGDDFHMPLERSSHCGPLEPHFPDAARVELLDMSEEEYLAIPATNESAERF